MGRDALTIGPDYEPFIKLVEARGLKWERGIFTVDTNRLYGIKVYVEKT